ncbi:MAG: M48 family metalloprotease [Candidatus Hodarchaeota archaeon]
MGFGKAMMRTTILFMALFLVFYAITIVFDLLWYWALILMSIIVFISYWTSDRIVRRMAGARIVTEAEAPELHTIVEHLAQKAGIPKPRVAIVDNPVPNAFATGRSPQKAVIAVHTGLLNVLNQEELEGVISHELTHVRNWDTLIMAIAAVVAGAIAFVARMAFWFSLGSRDSRNRTSPYAVLIAWLLAPIAALLIQLAISRGREYAADRGGAELTGRPISLANALEKIHTYKQKRPLTIEKANPAIAHLYIINPFRSQGIVGLFSTHPSLEDRIKRLEAMKGLKFARGPRELRPEDYTISF